MIYQNRDANFGILGRCIGHSGMPQSRTATSGLPRAEGADYERADWRTCKAGTVQGNPLSSAAVLEGPNEYIVGEEKNFSPHGYAVLTLDGRHLKEQVLTPTGAVIYEKSLD